MKAMQMLFEWLAPPAPKRPRPIPVTTSSDDAALLARAREILREAGCHTLASRVRVEWSARLKTTAGIACFRDYLVRLNPQLQRFPAAEADRTLRHELPHLLAHERAGRRRIAAHGPEWRAACATLGIPDESRCHTLPLQGRRRQERRLCYVCKSCGQQVLRVRPFKHRSACLDCCRRHNQGRYDERFRFVKIAVAGQGALPNSRG